MAKSGLWADVSGTSALPPIADLGADVALGPLLTQSGHANLQAVAGLVLAGTDIFCPPIGNWIAGWIAAEGIDLGSLVPYAKEMYDEQAYQDMRAFRTPFITTHLYAFYVLMAVVLVHVAAVIVTEIREGGTLVSALFTGRKIIASYRIS